jgi:beta-N-acetylhexosaminidase
MVTLNRVLLLLLFFAPLFTFQVAGQTGSKSLPDFMQGAEPVWVKEQMKKMTMDEKIGQMFFAAAYSNKDQKHENELLLQIQNYHLGGLIFFQGGPQRQLRMTRALQEKSKIPLFIAMDAEWGPAMRLDSVQSWPYQMQLGALESDEQIYEMGSAIAGQLTRLGVHINFAPVVDVNSNPDNPVINHRSFGSDAISVSRKSLAYAKGMQENGIMPVAKHFPGHGDTDTDSHTDLPVVNRSKHEILAGEGIPYQKLIEEGLAAVMVAHILLPAIDAKYPASLSKKLVNDFLKGELGFGGLVFTDALNMKGAKSFSEKPGELEIQAILAGADVLLMPDKLPQAIQAVKDAVKKGQIPAERINESCRKILRAKHAAGLNKKVVPSADRLLEDLNKPAYQGLNELLRANSITLLKNTSHFLPIKDLKSSKPLAVYFGKDPEEVFKVLNQYESVQVVHATQQYLTEHEADLMLLVKDFTQVYLFFGSSSQLAAKKFGLEESNIIIAEKIAAIKPSVLILLGNPYGLKFFSSLTMYRSVILGYDGSQAAKSAAVQAIYGGKKFRGSLPVNLQHLQLKSGDGLFTYHQMRLGYQHPFLQSLNSDTLARIDQLIEEGIAIGAFPGCQVLVARGGQVVLEKSYGHHTYEKKKPVSNRDLYDLASITKIAATTPILMRLWETGSFRLEDTLSGLLAVLDTTNKRAIRNLDVLTHQSGLAAWIPFYKTYTDQDSLYQLMFSRYRDSIYSMPVADSLWLHYSIRDSLFKAILISDTLPKVYRYSDLGFYLYKDWIENNQSQPLNELSENWFYSDLGAERMTYLPLNRFEKPEIVPTEMDTIFRRQLIQGYVHDMGAAMQGGVGGHAGLFSNAGDLAKLMQLYLWEGTYGGERYFKPETIRYFTTAPFLAKGNRRAIGFDKPARENQALSPVCSAASDLSYGHSGFTGTLAWVDPRFDLIFIFLSNRIHPTTSNKKLIEKSYRTKIQEVVYNAMN